MSQAISQEVLDKVFDKFANTKLAVKQIAWDLGLSKMTVYHIRNKFPLLCWRPHGDD